MEIKKDICDILQDNMMEYSAYAILHRALPNGYDGLKPSYRRIIYTMLKSNMTKLTKSANLTGDVMKIHPHGDSYPTIVGMTQQDNQNNPFIIGKGTFGQHTSRDLQPASARYTEVKISEYALDMMKSLDKNIVQMIPTYDGVTLEPLVLPVRHPQALTVVQSGMAVGMASSTPSFNLGEVCDATIEYIKNGTIPMLVPDFATGGSIIYDEGAITSINTSGKGTIRIRGNCTIVGNVLTITEIPYTTTREQIIDKVIELVKSGKLKEISDIQDMTDLKGMSVEITCKKNTDMELLKGKLYQLTPLESTFSANMNMLFDDIPLVVGVHGIIERWVGWRKRCIVNVLNYDIEKLSNKLHLLKGLEKCLLDIDKVVDIIRKTKEDLIVITLCKEFGLDEEQAEEVTNMKLRHINRDYILKKVEENKKLEKNIQSFKEAVNNDEILNDYVIKGLEDVKSKFGKPRNTSTIELEEIQEVKKEDLIEDYNCQIVVTNENYIKKTLRYSETQKTKDGDFVVQQTQATNLSNILLFTNIGNVYMTKAHQLEVSQPSTLGSYLPSFIPLDKDEEIIYTVVTNDYEGEMLFAFENGKVAKVPLISYQTKTARTKLVNAYNTNEKLVYIEYIKEDKDFMCISSIGIGLVFNSSKVPSKASRTTQGVNVMKSKKDSKLAYVKICSTLEISEEDIEYYTTTNIPAVGNTIKKEHKHII